LRDRIASMNAAAVIPSKRNRKIPIPHDAGIYKLWIGVEKGPR
jgi:hypothetical protein